MKSTDLARRDRELKRARKKAEVIQRKSLKSTNTVGDFIDQLAGMLFNDGQRIYGISDSTDILEFLENMKEQQPEKQWETIIRKAVKKTKVIHREEAVKELMELGEIGG